MTRWSSASVVRLLVATSLTGLVLWKANPAAVVRAVAGANLWWFAVAVGLVAVDRALMAYRWLVLLRPIEARPPFGVVMHVFFVSTFIGTFLPASIGGDAVRAYRLTKLQIAPGQAVASVLMDRLLGVMSIVLVGLIGFVVAPTGAAASLRAVSVAFLAASAACGLGALVVFSDSAARAAAGAARRLPFAKLRRLAGELTNATRAYARFHAELALVLLGSIGVQGLRVLQAYCLGRGLGLETPLVVYLALIPLILLVMLLPVSINGIGTSQVAFVWFFGSAGVAAAEAFALSVLFVALGVLGNLPGAVLYALTPPPRRGEPGSYLPSTR